MNKEPIISKPPKIRDSNFELLRLLAMGLVITSHFNFYSFPQEIIGGDFSINILLKYLFTAGCISNLIFILLTGYFMIKSKPNYKKIIGLLLEMYFYSILFFILAIIFKGQKITLSELAASLLPFPFGNWFCVSYIVLYLCIPFLNKLMLSSTRAFNTKLLTTSFIVFSLLPTITLGHPSFSKFSVFILGYIIGAFVRLYNINIRKKVAIEIIAICSTLITSSVIAIKYLANNTTLLWFSKNTTFFLTSNYSVFVIAIATLFFLLFKNIKIKPNILINTFASSTLGIYLIHENTFVRHFIWEKLFCLPISSPTPIFITYAILKIILVFIACLIIDQLRMLIFKKLEKQLSEKIFLCFKAMQKKFLNATKSKAFSPKTV